MPDLRSTRLICQAAVLSVAWISLAAVSVVVRDGGVVILGGIAGSVAIGWGFWMTKDFGA